MMVGRERGSALSEALVSLALTGLILSAVLPAVLQARAMGSAASRRAQLGDSGRLIGRRMAEDLRRAGFGLAGRLPGVTLGSDGQEILIQYLEQGFSGGQSLAAGAVAGEDLLQVAALGGVKAGDTCLLADRNGQAQVVGVTAVNSAERTVLLNAPLTQSFHPETGARLTRVTQRRWWLADSDLRRDGQTALQTVAGFSITSWARGESSRAVSWAVESEPVDLLPPAEGVVAVRLGLGGSAELPAAGRGTATPGLDLAWLVRPVNADPMMVAGSSLP